MSERDRGQADRALAELGYDTATTERVSSLIAASSDPSNVWARLIPVLEGDPSIVRDESLLEKVVAVTSDSRALSTALAKSPDLVAPQGRGATAGSLLRSALFDIAGDDLTGRTDLSTSTRRYSAAIDEIVVEELSRARAGIAERHPVVSDLPFAIIAMGKWAGRELNYYSDIDLLFVHEPVDALETESRAAALALASRLLADLSAQTFEGPMLNVDADLRPEGAMGPLSRSLDSYKAYYDRWGEAWELQALLKTRFVAGDEALGHRFTELASRIVWEEGLNHEALRSIRTLKAQAEANADPDDIKRSRGGIRDIEFTIQLMQLVHGRFDPDLRVKSSIEALDALGAHGYIEDSERESMVAAYTFLRNLEHRLQLWDLQQTHRLPKSSEPRARLARSMGFSGFGDADLMSRLDEIRATVRDMHERLYFRPMLDSLVGVDDAWLDRGRAERQVEALGFRDVVAATTALSEMTTGLSRKSRVMQQALPLMIDWLSVSPDPDLGLHQLRILLGRTPDHSALVRVIQNNPLAGERLCMLLGTGSLLGELMDRIPEFIPRLEDEDRIAMVRGGDATEQRLMSLLESRADPDEREGTIRRFVRRRKLRVAARDILAGADAETTLLSLADTADAAIKGALYAAGQPLGFAVIAMGKWGGRELSYGSDLDLMYVYDDPMSRTRALEIPLDLERLLSRPSTHGPAYELDAELRPEGRKGPMARSIDSYERYYEEWLEPWERLALVKARPVAGDTGVTAAFLELVGRTLWKQPADQDTIHGIRQIKARIEAERIPPGEDPDFHLKLGPGGLSDVEFVVQLLQLKLGHTRPELRVAGTIEALEALRDGDSITMDQFNALHDSYLFCTRARLRLHLQSGQPADSLPRAPDATERLAASLGFDRTGDLREEYQRYTRRARRVFEDLFFE